MPTNTIHPDPTRYSAFYQTLLDWQVPIVKLKRGEKGLAGNSISVSRLSSLDEIIQALRDGFNLGMVSHTEKLSGANPHGVETLDLDAADHGLDLTPFNGFMVRREGELIRQHLYFRHPYPSLPRTGNQVRGKYDLMMWNVVLPGSIHRSGTMYELYVQVNHEWKVWSGEPLTLDLLPVIDPDQFRPVKPAKPSVLVSATASSSGTGVSAQSPYIGGLNSPAYLTAKGTLRDREIQGRAYVRGRIRNGFVSKSGKGGRATLFATVNHLTAYLQLPLETALNFLTTPLSKKKGDKSWNAHCIDAASGKPYPWTNAEIQDALEDAARFVPPFGVLRWEEAQVRRAVMEKLKDFIWLLSTFPEPEPGAASMRTGDLAAAFRDLYDLPDGACGVGKMGQALRSAIKGGVISLVPKVRTRAKLVHYLGVDPDSLGWAAFELGLHRPSKNPSTVENQLPGNPVESQPSVIERENKQIQVIASPPPALITLPSDYRELAAGPVDAFEGPEWDSFVRSLPDPVPEFDGAWDWEEARAMAGSTYFSGDPDDLDC